MAEFLEHGGFARLPSARSVQSSRYDNLARFIHKVTQTRNDPDRYSYESIRRTIAAAHMIERDGTVKAGTVLRYMRILSGKEYYIDEDQLNEVAEGESE